MTFSRLVIVASGLNDRLGSLADYGLGKGRKPDTVLPRENPGKKSGRAPYSAAVSVTNSERPLSR